MALPNYQSGVHHIGLAERGATQKGLMIAGGYNCSPQREAAPAEFGGEGDLTRGGVMSRWTQDDFSGGAYLDVWGPDPAMFAASYHVVPGLVQPSVRSIAPLAFWYAANWPEVGIFTTGGKIAMHYTTFTLYVDPATASSTSQDHTAAPLYVAVHDPADNYVYGIVSAGANIFKMKRFKEGVAPAIIGSSVPGGFDGVPRGMSAAGSDFIAALGTVLYLADLNDAKTDCTWTRVGRLPGLWMGSCVQNGLTYILLNDGGQRTSVVAWDGSQILPVVEIPDNFQGRSICAYGGRVYVGGSANDVNGGARYAELYEITGGSLRTVASFGDRIRAGQWAPSVIWSMTAHEGLLWLGTDQGFLLSYDQARDAIYGGPYLRNVFDHFGIHAWKLFSFQESLWAFGYDGLDRVSPADGIYKLATTVAESDFAYDGQIETSTFAPQSWRDKRWSQLAVHTRFGPSSVSVSTDGGATYGSTLTGTVESNGNEYLTTFDLSDLDPSASIRFFINLPRAAGSTAYTELVAYTCRFIFLDSGLFGWTFAINGALNVEGDDGSTVEQDPNDVRAALRDYWTNRTGLDFTDLDGSVHQVTLTDFQEDQAVIGSPVPDSEVGGAVGTGQRREALFHVAFLEDS